MSAIVACITGGEVHRQWQEGRLLGEQIGPRRTPFGNSADIFLVEGDGEPFYLLPRNTGGQAKPAPSRVNSRANIYALKDLGVRHVLAWGPGGAVTHNIAVGELVIFNDLLDLTYLRDRTFFEDSPLGYLRQFPVFCPSLASVVCGVLDSMKLIYHSRGTAAVSEGPRLETPAEVRRLATVGAEVATHHFVPEVFLAKELQMCYAGVCYVVNYAETGSRHRPFMPGDLFGGLTQKSEHERLAGVIATISRIVHKVATTIRKGQMDACDCHSTMQANINEYDLSNDWREWFTGNNGQG